MHEESSHLFHTIKLHATTRTANESLSNDSLHQKQNYMKFCEFRKCFGQIPRSCFVVESGFNSILVGKTVFGSSKLKVSQDYF